MKVVKIILMVPFCQDILIKSKQKIVQGCRYTSDYTYTPGGYICLHFIVFSFFSCVFDFFIICSS